jgi:hypothetical protein
MSTGMEIRTYFDYSDACKDAEVFADYFIKRFEGFQRYSFTIKPVHGCFRVLVDMRLEDVGWVEEGQPVYMNNVPVGLHLFSEVQKYRFVPMKPYERVVHTEDGSIFILYCDGEAICRSAAGEWMEPIQGIYFATEIAVNAVFDDGGLVQGVTEPAPGLEIFSIVPSATITWPTRTSLFFYGSRSLERLGRVARIYQVTKSRAD